MWPEVEVAGIGRDDGRQREWQTAEEARGQTKCTSRLWAMIDRWLAVSIFSMRAVRGGSSIVTHWA